MEFTAAYIVIANIAGYLTGMGVADLIGNISRSPLTVHAVSTFVTTELLGWTIILLTRIFRVGHRKSSWTPRIRWLIAATAVIFLIRLAYTEIFNSRYFTAESSYRIIRMLLGNSFRHPSCNLPEYHLHKIHAQARAKEKHILENHPVHGFCPDRVRRDGAPGGIRAAVRVQQHFDLE